MALAAPQDILREGAAAGAEMVRGLPAVRYLARWEGDRLLLMKQICSLEQGKLGRNMASTIAVCASQQHPCQQLYDPA
jgi:hypothetical protein